MLHGGDLMIKRSIIDTAPVGLDPEQIAKLKDVVRFHSVSMFCRASKVHYPDFINWLNGTKKPLKIHKKYIDFCQKAFGVAL